ncbi:hypothetical protein CALVIDRAFT_410946 [Calocera viscosa TUFC12733]|uniref:Fungal-type protein kinase domain-containing protein n=1 Tax=Calocera viscosa (strain TUFC12733) TaxID=1330018 RepID=A0A167G7E3_CALVF|nr:hypothetical protein CALVIDRAFT_410946 [Calocera viscosa TUFC12733]
MVPLASDEDVLMVIYAQGTPDFMAVEVLIGRYTFVPARIERQFRYNAGHDLESIWWIAFFLLYSLLIVDKTAEGDNDDNNAQGKAIHQRRSMEIFFSQTKLSPSFGSPSFLSPVYKDLKHSLVQDAVDILESLLDKLLRKYSDVQKRPEDDEDGNKAFLEVHDAFIQGLTDISALFKNEECERVEEVIRAMPEKPKKLILTMPDKPNELKRFQDVGRKRRGGGLVAGPKARKARKEVRRAREVGFRMYCIAAARVQHGRICDPNMIPRMASAETICSPSII